MIKVVEGEEEGVGVRREVRRSGVEGGTYTAPVPNSVSVTGCVWIVLIEQIINFLSWGTQNVEWSTIKYFSNSRRANVCQDLQVLKSIPTSLGFNCKGKSQKK